MSKKKKSSEEKLVTEVQPEIKPQEEPSELTTYQEFFFECLGRRMIKSHQEKEIQAFFKDLGLSNKEPKIKYLDALKKF